MSSKRPSLRVITVEAQAEDAGSRIDRWLAARVPELSRSRIQSLIRDGHVRSGGTIGEPRHAVKPGQIYEIEVPEAAGAVLEAEPIGLEVVHEDADLIVIDKPAGLVVHPGAGHASGTLVNALIAHCGTSLSGIGGVKRPGIVHRLDKDTSGLLVVAKNDAAHQGLSGQFKSHGRDGRLHRSYLALVWGTPSPRHGVIDAPLARSAANRTKISVARANAGREAITHFDVVKSFDGPGTAGVVSLVRLQLETGRTHQIRVHMAHIGHPILGDQLYGAGFKTRVARLHEDAREKVIALGRQALHAAELGFEHPRRATALHFQSAIPEDIQEVIDALEVAEVGGQSARSSKRSSPRPRGRKH